MPVLLDIKDAGSILGQEDSLEEGMAMHSSILPGESHGQGSLAGYSPWAHKDWETTKHWSLEKAMAPHSSALAWRTPWMEEPGSLQSMGSWRVRHDWATSLSLFTFTHWRRKWQPTPVFLPGESQEWWRSHRVGHDWSDLAAAAAAEHWSHSHINELKQSEYSFYYLGIFRNVIMSETLPRTLGSPFTSARILKEQWSQALWLPPRSPACS